MNLYVSSSVMSFYRNDVLFWSYLRTSRQSRTLKSSLATLASTIEKTKFVKLCVIELRTFSRTNGTLESPNPATSM